MILPAFTFEKLSSPAPRASASRAPEPSVETAKPRGRLRRMLDRFTARSRVTTQGSDLSKPKQAGQR